MTTVEAVRVEFVERRRGGNFVIEAPQSRKRYTCSCQEFFPIEVGDILYGSCEVQQGDRLLFRKAPLAIIPETQMATMTLLTGLPVRLTIVKANEFYEEAIRLTRIEYKLDEKSKDIPAAVCFYLDNKAYEFSQNQSMISTLSSLSNIITVTKLVGLLENIHKRRNKRRLWLLGLNNREIRGCMISHPVIYQRIMTKAHGIFTFANIPIKKCVEVAMRLGIRLSQEHNSCAIIVRILYNNITSRAYTATPVGLLHKMCSSMGINNLNALLPLLYGEYGVIKDLNCFYLPYQYKVERELSIIIHDLLTRPRAIEYELKDLHFEHPNFTNEQKQAVLNMVNNNLSILQAPAGCGKSVSIKEFVSNLDRWGKKYYMCAATACAAERMKALTGKEAYTIHRLLIIFNQRIRERKDGELVDCKVNGPEDGLDYLIIDEHSMVNCGIFYRLISRAREINNNVSVALIGDENQLPTISWGNLILELRKLKNTSPLRSIPTATLNENHRILAPNDGILAASKHILGESSVVDDNIDYGFDEEDMISVNSSAINFKQTDNFRILCGGINLVYELLGLFYKAGVKQDEITIISPFNTDLPDLNSKFQEIFNEGAPAVKDIKGREWQIGSRIMCTRNCYKKNIFNGTVGKVTNVNSKILSVRFRNSSQTEDFPMPQYGDQDIKRRFGAAEDDDDDPDEEGDVGLDQLSIAYALTTHKMQGSENENIIIWLPASKDSGFLNKYLIYTAFTRARRNLYVVGDYDTLAKAVRRNPKYRCDNLAERINKLFGTPQLLTNCFGKDVGKIIEAYYPY